VLEAARALHLGDDAAVKIMITSDAFQKNCAVMLLHFMKMQQSGLFQVPILHMSLHCALTGSCVHCASSQVKAIAAADA
jgi:hypothetical protein